MLGRLASFIVKKLLNGQKLVLVYCEEIRLSGDLRINTKNSHGRIHFIKEHRDTTLARFKAYEDIPIPYDNIKRMAICDYYLFGGLSSKVASSHADTINEIEEKRNARSQLRLKAEKITQGQLGAQLEFLRLVKYQIV
ncbi:hypothetical protein MKX03_021714 [Papaver bracteatum]|nr:hypothetical protein MKX03_021714 [Papaver bracteatum]